MHPLLGEDLAGRLPGYRPTSLPARETNGDLELLLPRRRQWAAAASTGRERARLGRRVGRHLVRTGFTLVMPRWGDWTGDLDEMAEVFAAHYPRRADLMRTAVAVGRRAWDADAVVLGTLLDDLGPWLAAEYRAVHGVRAPRPGPRAETGSRARRSCATPEPARRAGGTGTAYRERPGPALPTRRSSGRQPTPASRASG
ncbi:hypothetical protein [Streptomyces gobitricini]|uniref:Uncharacterized protein n=1 Tax=Streptomyces gobitricini TaxID=68211 RepID=A0ABN3N2H3_9ACTN